MSNNGFPIPAKHVPSIALVVLRQRSSIFQTPASDDIKAPGKKWTELFFKRHPEIHPRRRKPLDWKRHDKNIFDKMTHWFETIGRMLQMPDIELGNVYNMDETGTMLCKLNSTKVVVGRDDKREYRGAGVERESISAIECISGGGKLLHPMIIWPAASHRAKWTTHRTPGWHYTYSDSGYTDSEISLEWLKVVFDPQTRARAGQKPRILIVDGFKTHETIEAIKYCLENNIHLCRLPSHTSHKLQPCDVGIFSPLKTAYRDLVKRMYRGGLKRVGKEHFASLYSHAREVAFTPHNISAGWRGSGLVPFNPDRVLSKTPQVPEKSSILKQEVSVGSRLRDVPHTPVTAEALTSLRCLIEQDIDELDEPTKHRVQKLANAAEKRFADCAILLDENKLLFEQNCESNVRKSTRSTVVGKAKVMSWEDLEKAKAVRAAKQLAAEEKKRLAAEKKKAAEEKKKATAEKKRAAAANRKKAAEEKKTAAAEKKRAAAERKQALTNKRKRDEESEDSDAGEGHASKKPRSRKKTSAEKDTAALPKVPVAQVSDQPEPEALVAQASDQPESRAPVAWMSELQDQARASAPLTKAQELAVQALVARMNEAQAAEDEIAARGMETYCSVWSLG
jgi:DDE superfamily endonuclease